MEQPLISVTIPAYNCAPWLERCLDSIVSNKRDDIEIIVVDDGSFDETPALLQRYAEADKRVRVIRQANAGLGAARNAAIDAAQGEWIMFVDADDQLAQGAIDQIAKAASSSHTQFIIWGYTDGANTHPAVHHAITDVWQTAVRHDFIDLKGLRFTPGYNSVTDIEFVLKYIALAEHTEVLNGALYHYIRREGSLSTVNVDYAVLARQTADIIINVLNAWSIWGVKPTALLNHLIYKRVIAMLVFLCKSHPSKEALGKYRTRLNEIFDKARSMSITSLSHPYIRLARTSMRVAMWVMRSKLRMRKSKPGDREVADI